MALKKHWGAVILVLTVVFSVVRLIQDQNIGHAQTFTLAAKALWLGTTPYSQTFAGNFFFYSPLCAMLLYGPLVLLPHVLGVVLYTLIGSIAFGVAIKNLATHYLDQKSRQWLYVTIAPQLFSALVAFKTEVWLLTMLLMTTTWILQNKRQFMAIGIIAVISPWKLQTFPILGLLVLLGIYQGQWRWMIAAVLGVVASFLAPVFWLGWQQNLGLHQEWLSSLHFFSSQAFAYFDNVFSFLKNSMGIQLTYVQAQQVAWVGALVPAVWIWHMLRARLPLPTIILGILVCSSIYIINFSPLQQINAYLFFAPVWLAAWVQWDSRPRSSLLVAAMLVTGTFLFLGYSDLIPPLWRQQIRHATLRPIFCDILGVVVLYGLKRMNSEYFLARVNSA